MSAGKNDSSVPQGVIVTTWGFYFGTLDDHLGDPGIHSDPARETLGVKAVSLSILGGFGDPLGNHFRYLFDNLLIFGTESRISDQAVVFG